MRFRIDDDTLTVIFQGPEQFWALKRKLVIPKVNIVRARWQPEATIPRRELGWRLGGSALPGLLLAGRFVGSQGANFIYLQRPHGLFGDMKLKHVFTMDLRHSVYKHLILTIDKPDIAEQIIAWWSSNV